MFHDPHLAPIVGAKLVCQVVILSKREVVASYDHIPEATAEQHVGRLSPVVGDANADVELGNGATQEHSARRWRIENPLNAAGGPMLPRGQLERVMRRDIERAVGAGGSPFLQPLPSIDARFVAYRVWKSPQIFGSTAAAATTNTGTRLRSHTSALMRSSSTNSSHRTLERLTSAPV
jgi:hypothetical protein